MTIKVKYENGVLRPLDDVKLENGKIYEIEIVEKRKVDIRYISANKIDQLCGIAKIGGDAVEDAEKLYE
jgi:predicted DNA-binding antitoxin AbrB/MazE fold protein